MMSGDEPVRRPDAAVSPPRLRARMPVMFKEPPRGWAAGAGRAMRRHKIATGVTAAGIALAVAATVIGAPGHARAAAPRVPGFTLPALGRAGGQVSLAAYAGRPVVVNFFASWCVPCKKETPLLARFFHGPRGRVMTIGVDVNDAPAAALSFVRKAGVTYPVGIDRSAATAAAWGGRRDSADVLHRRRAPRPQAGIRRRDARRADQGHCRASRGTWCPLADPRGRSG